MTSSEPGSESAGGGTGEQDGDTVPPKESVPAFGFESNMQENIYVRDESWRELQDAISFETKRVLAQYGLRDDDLFKRELHDAMVRTAANHPEEMAHRIIQDRDVATQDELTELNTE